MAVIKPFKALLYNSEKITDMSLVTAPPYDVISPKRQDELYENSPYNIVRLDYGKKEHLDTNEINRYTRASESFKSWMKKDILVRDGLPAIYPYEQDYKIKDGTTRTRKGFMALVRLEELDSGVILPHERTLAGPKADRLNLLRACSANFSPIFSLYSDQKLKTNRIISEAIPKKPLVDIQDGEGVSHRLWRIKDKEAVTMLADEMLDKMIFIADGHHRYETALSYRNELRRSNPDFSDSDSFNYTLMYFSNMDDEGLTVFPTHRLIYDIKGFDSGIFEGKLSEYFSLHKFNMSEIMEKPGNFMKTLSDKGRLAHSFGVYAEGWDHACIISLKDLTLMDRLVPEHSGAYRRLDVTILHNLIIENILGISRESIERKEHIEYIQEENKGLIKVAEGKRQILFLLNPTKVSEVEDVAMAKDVMPQKSTYFYPKLLTGLILNKID